MSEDPHKVMPPAPDDFERFVQNLAQLSPSAPTRSRNQLLFEAGRASTRIPNLWVWQVSAIAFAALSLILGLALLWPSPPQIQFIDRERVVIQYRDREPQTIPEEPEPFGSPTGPTSSSEFAVSTPSIPPEDTPTDDTRKMLRLRNGVIRFGVEMLPRVDGAGESPPSTSSTVETEASESIHLPRGTFAVPNILKRRAVTDEE